MSAEKSCPKGTFLGDEFGFVFGSVTPLILLMAELLHQLIGSLSHYLQGVKNIQGGCLGFQPSRVRILKEGMVIPLNLPYLEVQDT